MHLVLVAAAASVRANCLFDYVSSLEESCFFGSDHSRLYLTTLYSTFVEGCDIKKCECPNPKIPELTRCDSYALKTMTQFMGIHPHTEAPEMSLYRNITAELNRICGAALGGGENEAGSLQTQASFGGCNPPSKPTTGHTAGITLYVTLISVIFSLIFLDDLNFVGSDRQTVDYTPIRVRPESSPQTPSTSAKNMLFQ